MIADGCFRFRRAVLYYPFDLDDPLRELKVLFSVLNFTKLSHIKPSTDMVKASVPTDFQIGAQQDASELLG